MDSKPGAVNRPNALVTLAAFVIVAAGLRTASAIVIPILLAGFIAVISSAPLFWLKRKGIPTVLAMIIVVTGVFVLILIVVALIGTSVDDFSQNLPFYQEQLKDKSHSVLSLLEKVGVNISKDKAYEVFNPSVAMKLATKMLSGLRGALTNGFLILFTVIFILLEASGFPVKLKRILDDPHRSLPYFETFIHTLQRYISIKTGLSLVTGIVVAIWLAVLGVDFPLLWGLLAFLLNYIPNIGSILASVPAVLLAFIQLGGSSALLTAVGYLVVNITIGSLLEPKIMGKGLGLSTLVVFLSLIFWGWLFGPVGMLLSVPLTMTLKIALDSREDTRWIAVLLGSEPSAKEEKAENTVNP